MALAQAVRASTRVCGREVGCQIGFSQAALGIGAQNRQLGPGHAGRVLPRHQVGVVLQAADDDFDRPAQPGFARPAAPQAKGHGVQRLGGAAGEGQFVLLRLRQ